MGEWQNGVLVSLYIEKQPPNNKNYKKSCDDHQPDLDHDQRSKQKGLILMQWHNYLHHHQAVAAASQLDGHQSHSNNRRALLLQYAKQLRQQQQQQLLLQQRYNKESDPSPDYRKKLYKEEEEANCGCGFATTLKLPPRITNKYCSRSYCVEIKQRITGFLEEIGRRTEGIREKWNSTTARRTSSAGGCCCLGEYCGKIIQSTPSSSLMRVFCCSTTDHHHHMRRSKEDKEL